MSPNRKEALGKFIINFVLLYLGAGIVTKIFSQEELHLLRIFFTLLPAFLLLIIGVYTQRSNIMMTMYILGAFGLIVAVGGLIYFKISERHQKKV